MKPRWREDLEVVATAWWTRQSLSLTHLVHCSIYLISGEERGRTQQLRVRADSGPTNLEIRFRAVSLLFNTRFAIWWDRQEIAISPNWHSLPKTESSPGVIEPKEAACSAAVASRFTASCRKREIPFAESCCSIRPGPRRTRSGSTYLLARTSLRVYKNFSGETLQTLQRRRK